MIGSFLTRGLVMIFGYAYPAYECYKTVEMNKPEVEQLRFWCQYWILVALMAVCERISDLFISWVPMYSEAKLAFYIYLWYPKTKGTLYVYDSFIKPYIVKHEKDIDGNLMELKTRAGDTAVMYFQKAASYGQTGVFEVLQYVASQPFPWPYQNQAPRAVRQPTVEELPSPTSSTSSSQHEEELEQEEVGTSPAPASPVAQKSPRKLTSASAKSVQLTPKKKAPPHSNNLESSKNSAVKKMTPESQENTDESADEAGPEQTEPAPFPPPQETDMEDTIRATRGSLRKSSSIVIKKDA